MRLARRVQNLPPYLFAELDRKVAAKRAAGADVISLGVGDPDLPTPDHVVEALRHAALAPRTRHPSEQYPCRSMALWRVASRVSCRMPSRDR